MRSKQPHGFVASRFFGLFFFNDPFGFLHGPIYPLIRRSAITERANRPENDFACHIRDGNIVSKLVQKKAPISTRTKPIVVVKPKKG